MVIGNKKWNLRPVKIDYNMCNCEFGCDKFYLTSRKGRWAGRVGHLEFDIFLLNVGGRHKKISLTPPPP